jgi:hypothetical protein
MFKDLYSWVRSGKTEAKIVHGFRDMKYHTDRNRDIKFITPFLQIYRSIILEVYGFKSLWIKTFFIYNKSALRTKNISLSITNLC